MSSVEGKGIALEDNSTVREKHARVSDEVEKQTNIAGLVLGILSIPFAFIFALVGWILSITGLVINVVKRKENKTTAGTILCIIGLLCSLVSSILGAMIVTGQISF